MEQLGAHGAPSRPEKGHGMKAPFWKGRRVLVTGHTGFIGSWLSETLLESGALVTGYALPAPTEPSLFESLRLWERVPTITADIRDAERLAGLIESLKPEVVFHLAAQPIVRTAHADPVQTFATNVMGTVNLLEALRRTDSVAAALIVTTDKVYENREWDWGYREGDRLGGQEPYGASKACCELATEAFRRAYFSASKQGPGLATIRAGNVIGGGDWAADRLVPDAARAFASGAVLQIRAPQSIRPWQHVLEPIAGMMELAERLAAAPEAWGGAWNLGPEEGDSRSVAWLADRLAEAWPESAGWEVVGHDGPREARLLSLSSARARERFGWRCRWTAEQAVIRTARWYRAFYRGEDMLALTREQICQHERDHHHGHEHRTQAPTRRRAVA